MIPQSSSKLNRAQISRASIQRLYISMRHLFQRGGYKPHGVSGEAMKSALLALKPEIYGSMADPDRVELDGLLYIFQRLPQGIEECRYVKLIAKEGYEDSQLFSAIVPSKRRRNCYRIDDEQMFIEMTRGRSDIYDVLTHLTFMYIEAEKIMNNALDGKDQERREWKMLRNIVNDLKQGQEIDERIGLSYLSTLLGRTYQQTVDAFSKFKKARQINSFYNIVYWLGQKSIEEKMGLGDREITFSNTLRERLGNHLHGELWSNEIKKFLISKGFINRPIHIISSNLHSVMNCIYARAALKNKKEITSLLSVAEELSIGSNKSMRKVVERYAKSHGMYQLDDFSGANIGVQIFDCSMMSGEHFSDELLNTDDLTFGEQIILVMDYAFGEQAYELMDELLKPCQTADGEVKLDVRSINIMGKAGTLAGEKGDIMIPDAHVFEGTADNYPVHNQMDTKIFDYSGLDVYQDGPMITVMGTSLQNRDILSYFHGSSWQSIGLEMEGAHYQKAIQAASQIRQSIDRDVTLRYAYYASDNPLKTGGTLASGALGKAGVKPTYLITLGILNGILSESE